MLLGWHKKTKITVLHSPKFGIKIRTFDNKRLQNFNNKLHYSQIFFGCGLSQPSKGSKPFEGFFRWLAGSQFQALFAA
jgi:hypothetical protein